MKAADFYKVTDWENFTGVITSEPVKKKRGEHEYTDISGRIKYCETKARLYLDEIWNVTRHCDDCTPDFVYTETGRKKTASGLIGRIPHITQVRASKFRSIYYVGVCPFREHTGAGHGGVKAFKKPSGEAFGIEIEMCFPDEDLFKGIERKLAFAEWVRSNHPDWITERDGSLEDSCRGTRGSARAVNQYEDHNLELVSPPLTENQLKKQLPLIINKAIELGAQTRKIGDWYGLHVTSNIFGPAIRKSACKMISTVNARKYRQFWHAVSNRPKSAVLKRYAPFLEVNKENALEVALNRGNHYMAAYPRTDSGGAVEIRIFQANIDIDYTLAIIELVAILSKFSMKKEDGEWLAFLKEEASPNLMEYLISSSAISQGEYDE